MIHIACPIYCHKVFYIIMEALEKELISMSYPVKIDLLEYNICHLQNEIIILFGSQHLQNLQDTILHNNVIVYNLEQLINKNWNDLLPRLQNTLAIFDYSSLNIDYITHHFHSLSSKHVLVPFGYSSSFKNPNIHLDTDNLIKDRIAFIGNISPRRNTILQKLQSIVPIDVYNHHYYNSYEDVVNKYQTFLNMHFHDDPNILEIVRILPLVINGRKVISERSDDQTIDNFLSLVVDYIDPFRDDIESLKQVMFSDAPSSHTVELLSPWKTHLCHGLSLIKYKHFGGNTKVGISTLHCNDRNAIFEVIESFAQQTSSRDFTWVVYSQGCSSQHNEQIRQTFLRFHFQYELIEHAENLGWSRGMNALYDYMGFEKFDYVLHLEDDWICHPETNNLDWFDDCCIYLHLHPDVSTLFLRKYISDEDKYMYGWTRNIFYQCFTHPNPFNYHEKIKSESTLSFRSLSLRRIPEFLYSANPTLFRLKHYQNKKVFPFPEFQDISAKQGEWKTTTMQDAPQWGFSEAISMEKIRDLTCINVNKGFFYHRN